MTLTSTQVDRHTVKAETAHGLNCNAPSTVTFEASLSHNNEYQASDSDFLRLSVHYDDGTVKGHQYDRCSVTPSGWSCTTPSILQTVCGNSPQTITYDLTGIDTTKKVDYFEYYYWGWHHAWLNDPANNCATTADTGSLFTYNSGEVQA